MKEKTLTEKQKVCLSCMECCKVIAVEAAINADNPRTKSFYEARGCRIIPTGKLPLIVIPYPCPNLSEAGCSIYDKRPVVCKQYDGRKDPVVKYTCLWRDEDAELR